MCTITERAKNDDLFIDQERRLSTAFEDRDLKEVFNSFSRFYLTVAQYFRAQLKDERDKVLSDLIRLTEELRKQEAENKSLRRRIAILQSRSRPRLQSSKSRGSRTQKARKKRMFVRVKSYQARISDLKLKLETRDKEQKAHAAEVAKIRVSFETKTAEWLEEKLALMQKIESLRKTDSEQVLRSDYNEDEQTEFEQDGLNRERAAKTEDDTITSTRFLKI